MFLKNTFIKSAQHKIHILEQHWKQREMERLAEKPADIVVDIQQIIRHRLHRQLMNDWRDWIKAAVDDQQL